MKRTRSRCGAATETFTAQVTSVLCEGSYKAGMWVRDSAAGIGTVTFYTEDGKAFGALGHGICDADTRNVLEIRSGEPAAVSVCGIERGAAVGRAACAVFTGGKSLGTLTQNTELGLYGKLSEPHEGETIEGAAAAEMCIQVPYRSPLRSTMRVCGCLMRSLSASAQTASRKHVPLCCT